MASMTIASSYLNTNTINPRDDPFSSYLNKVGKSFSDEPIYSCRTRSSFQISSSRRITDDGEIDIFSAEKYFNGTMDYNTDQITSNNEVKPLSKNEAKRSTKSRSKKTHSMSSEASGNSQTGLLKQTNRRKKLDGKKFLGVFPCTCIGNDAVDTEKEIIGSEVGSFGHEHKIIEEKRMRMERIGLGFKERLLTYPPNSIPNIRVVRRESKEVEKNNYDDIEDTRSECSSDLFEIKSLSIKSHAFFDTEEAYESPIYEPSEASIEWSIITASAANFSIDTDEKRKKTARNNRAGLLTGCVSDRAVNVTDDLVKINREDASMKIKQVGLVQSPLMRYQMERRENIGGVSRIQARQHVYTR